MVPPPASCDGDLTAPVITVGNPVVVHELGVGLGSPIFSVVEQCQIAMSDDCDVEPFVVGGVSDLRVISRDVEVIGGGPGGFVTNGIAMDWYDYGVNLERGESGPRTYSVEYAVLDDSDNWSYATCEIRVIDPLAPDWCNGIDDDADGQIDEDAIVEPITCGAGECVTTGEIICIDGVRTDTCEAAAPTGAEVCNGLDDDCDGMTDEGFGIGDTCTSGLGQCQTSGQLECSPQGLAICNAVPGSPADELCGNNIDEDCDGITDEGYADGNACPIGVGSCQRDGVYVCTEDRRGVECVGDPGPSPTGGIELCGSGADEDCDGETDEPDCDGDYGCDPDVAGPWVDVATPVLTYELRDSDRPMGGRIREYCGLTWSDNCTTDGFLYGIAEVSVDDPNETITGIGGSYRSEGIVVDWHNFTVELDRNRIGPRTYTFTYSVIDTAQNTTQVQCIVDVIDPDGGPPPVADDCDGVDNDGEGETDEDFTSRAVTCGIGACQAQGATACIDGVEIESCEPGAPGEELCDNGTDEDCDDETDEGFGIGGACSAGIGACTRGGQMICNADGSGVICDAVAGAPAGETCDNGVDEDCDGETDEADCEAPVSCDPDLTGPFVTVNQPEVIFELADGYVYNRTRLAEACDIHWVDACYDAGYLSGILDVTVDSPEGEVMGGEPGYFQSPGLLADWHNILLNLDRNEIGPRTYTFTYRVLDAMRQRHRRRLRRRDRRRLRYRRSL